MERKFVLTLFLAALSLLVFPSLVLANDDSLPILITSPAGGEKITAGDTLKIEWNQSKTGDSAKHGKP